MTAWRETACGHCVGIALLLYGLFNTYLFVKFTPVYSATSCGDQTAEIKNFEIGETILVSLEIHVLCSNPNPYQVKILKATPGNVYIGEHRGTDVGVLTLLEGSALPAEGEGLVKVLMESEISKSSSGSLAKKFLGNGEIPIFMELKFDVGIDINFGLQRFGTTAPFDKKCGMNIGAMFQRAANKLGPMVCRDSFEELVLPDLGEAPGPMSFSAAQMDPDRIRMGERLKNVSILGVGGVCYLVGFFLTYSLWLNPWHYFQWPLSRSVSRSVSREFSNGNGLSLRRILARDRSPNPQPSPKRDGNGERVQMMSLLTCGAFGWWNGSKAQPHMAGRSESQASGELRGLQPSCLRSKA
ncbi:unnamed protein product [Effrenium voratum]|uniref:Uncharacterized protein n=1 Tax=Effrenium voratum TaxID=2562239 RepID=A0AA36IFI7_9DINO|nr:unnamed protein product [Effrenium voratum]CAJ1385309.1 unnamed protein product [Effrenium voratum]CAJ1454950.1 unnamed protein product [Effrenium voratum]